MKKKLVIIVPGSKTKMTSSPLVAGFLSHFYTYFGVSAENKDTWTEDLRAHLLRASEGTVEVKIFDWSGGISKTLSLRPAARELQQLIAESRESEVILFCKSLGGVVGELSAQKDGGRRVKKLIYVATPHRPLVHGHCKDVEVINIYSQEDSYLRLANRALYAGLGKLRLRSATNICLPDVGHSAFNENREVLYKGKKERLFDVYSQIILRE